MTITTELAGALAPAAGRPEAPTARLLLPATASAEEWHATRAAGIGGSDIAAILGLDKYKSPRHVYEAKHGRGDKVTSEAAEIGVEIEDFIATLFGKRAEVPIGTPSGTLVNLERSWMLANVDRYALDPETGAVVAPIECKNRSEYQLDDWEDGVPDAPALQAHWYMAVGGWSYAWVVALVGGNKLKYHRLERDEDLIGELVAHCGGWFQRHIVEGHPPPADGLAATKELLGRLWQVKPEEVATVDLAKAKDLRARRAELRAQAKDVETQLNEVENEMRLLTEDAAVAKVGTAIAWTWKQNGAFASKRFREAMPELAARYTRMLPALDMDALKEEQPDVYGQFRARVLNVPKKEI
ncbi:YqaJ viral recombinase family nuclease [[Kitasatospora] papulosa]|uniref:YqaJ viral recombinase family nuclease n=1 Tax=[Kitasatospora] papulosa TaxID=1464011 RepID=UPI003690BE44